MYIHFDANIYLFKELYTKCVIHQSVDLNAITEFQETIFDGLLDFAVVLEGRSHHIVQDVNHFDVFGKSLFDFALVEKAFATFFQHFSVLEYMEFQAIET